MSDFRPKLGVIEGFYGHPWPQTTRRQVLPWFAALGLQAYLYAPKADAALRRAWSEPWSAGTRAQLRELAGGCAAAGLEFSVGLSPYELYRCYDAPARAALRRAVEEIGACGAAGLSLLFDDMPGEQADLARRQAEICADVQLWAPQLKLRLCPTYYSDDPILDKVFGARPEAYLETLGPALPKDVEVFWTGPKVCSDAVPATHVQAVGQRLGRPLALWDNYPVNDSRLRSEHLYLDPLAGRDAAAGPFLASHWCNAMNQAALSLPALASLVQLYEGREAEEGVLAEAGLSCLLRRACEPLATVRRDELAPEQRATLEQCAQGSSAAARELRAWLDGYYTFDPACLTD